MKQQHAVLLLAITMCGCNNSESYSAIPRVEIGDVNFDYRDISNEDFDEVESTWASRDLSAQNVKVVGQYEENNLSITLVSHSVNNKIHYAAILSPNPMPDTPAPVILQASGLDKDHPEVYVQYFVDLAQRKPALASYIQVIPAFRGDVLIFRDRYLTAQGNRCDAWDGPTDDAIASVNAARVTVLGGNYSSLLASGASRGGTVALLMAMRDSRVNTVLATAAPVDFYRQEVSDLYQIQYPCWFFNGKSESESRFYMLASSPAYFKPASGTKYVYLFYGENDLNVPVWNAYDMTSLLDFIGVPVTTQIYQADHFSIGSLPAYNQDYDSVIHNFLDSRQ